MNAFQAWQDINAIIDPIRDAVRNSENGISTDRVCLSADITLATIALTDALSAAIAVING